MEILVVQCFSVNCGYKLHTTAKASEEVNRKCPHPRNTMVQQK